MSWSFKWVVISCLLFTGGLADMHNTHIVSLSPADKALNVQKDIKINATYDNPIVPSSVKKHTIELKTIHKHIKCKIKIQQDTALVFTPDHELRSGRYFLHIDSIRLKDQTPIRPKTWFQKLIYKMCSKVHKAVRDCWTYRVLFNIHDIRTKPLFSSFTVNDAIPVMTNLIMSASRTELKEGSEANLTVNATYSDNTTKEITGNTTYTIGDSSVISINDHTI